MGEVLLPFDFARLSVVFEDEVFCSAFARVFACEPSLDGNIDETIFVEGNEEEGYCIKYSGAATRADDAARAVYVLTRIIGEKLCCAAKGDVAVLHAASVLTEKGIVAFFGPSGSGKTSLSIAFSRCGSYVGDEFAFVDLCTGAVWHENHPLQLKEGNPVLLSSALRKFTLKATGEAADVSYYVSLEALPHVLVKRSDAIPLVGLVLPHFNARTPAAELSLLPASVVPSAILGSLKGEHCPADLLVLFLRMVSTNDIGLYEISYSDSDAAVNILEKTIL